VISYQLSVKTKKQDQKTNRRSY